MRLIDADDLINELTSFREQQEDPKNKDIATTVSLFIEIYARTTPPIDISVVRCKDCKYWVKKEVGGSCEMIFKLRTSDNFFCANGKMRSE